MRNPARKIFFYLAMLLVGAALCAVSISMVGPTGDDWRWGVAGAIGITLFLIGLVQMLFAMLHSRGETKLRAGEDVLERWSVTPEEWERFRTFDRIRGDTPGTFANDLTYDEERPSLPVNIIVGRKSVLIGDSYHVLRRGGIPGMYALYWLPAPADPECLEFHISYPRHRSPPLRMTLRFPVPERYRDEGVRVYEHFIPLMPTGEGIAIRNPGLTIAVSLAIASVGATAFAWGMWRIKAGNFQEVEPLLAAIFGGIFGVAALLIALITAIVARRRA